MTGPTVRKCGEPTDLIEAHRNERSECRLNDLHRDLVDALDTVSAARGYAPKDNESLGAATLLLTKCLLHLDTIRGAR